MFLPIDFSVGHVAASCLGSAVSLCAPCVRAEHVFEIQSPVCQILKRGGPSEELHEEQENVKNVLVSGTRDLDY